MRTLSPLLLVLLCAFSQASTPQLTARPAVLAGDSPDVAVSGLAPGEAVVVHGLRMTTAWVQGAEGQWSQQPVTVHAWAGFTADGDGRIDLNTTAPVSGSYRQADGLGLIWSGFRQGAPELSQVADAAVYEVEGTAPSTVIFRLARGGRVVAEARTRIATQRGAVTTVEISQPGLVGVFAAPEGATGLPVLIQLHGSEGSDPANARARAVRFASRGYATLALTYFSRFAQVDADPNTADDLVEIPVEMIDRARTWLRMRPEADVERIALHGWSKGAEFSLVAAQRYPWIDAVVACVPSDLVWQGGGAEPGRPQRSSWTFEGRPLPFVPLYPYIPEEGLYRTNTDRYERSLRELGDAGGGARIAIDRSPARFLLLGGDRDAVWASGEMARRLSDQMAAAGRSADVEVATYAMAGHDICGDGAGLTRLYFNDPPGPQTADATASGQATGDAARRTLDFLGRTIGPAHVF